MTNSRAVTVAFVALLALSACGESKARTATRALARRNSCVAAELALDAKERLASLDTARAKAEGTALAQMTEAGYTYAAAYKAWADAASRAADLEDSAVTAPSSADSARYAQESATARPRVAAPGTTEANAALQYSRDVTRALGNPDHPCNKPDDSGS